MNRYIPMYIIALAIPLAFAGPKFAMAQPSLLSTKLAQFEQVTVDDLDAAVKIFAAANNAAGQTCASAWLNLAKANATVNATTLPKLHLFADLAKLYNIHTAFQAGSAVRNACAIMKDDILGSGTGILGGASLVKKFVPALAMLGI
jgi:hypothetical protein